MEHSLPVTEAAKSGNILTAERVRQGLTVEAVAEKLRLRPYQVEALESGDFSKLPQGTFLRGFMKNYAKLLGIEQARVLAALEEQVPPVAANPDIVVPSQNIRYRADGAATPSASFKGMLIAAAVLVGAFVAIYAWMSVRVPGSTGETIIKDGAKAAKASTPPPASGSDAPLATTPTASGAPSAPVGGSPNAPAIAATSTTATPATASGSASAATPDSAVVSPPSSAVSSAGAVAGTGALGTSSSPGELPAAPALRAGEGNTTFTFAAKSWVQIKDARGRVIHQREHEPGSTLSLDVPVGASLIVGNSKNVRMLRAGREVDLAQHTDVNVARLKAE